MIEQTASVYCKPMDVSVVASNEGRVLKLSWTDMRHGDKGRLGQGTLSPTPTLKP